MFLKFSRFKFILRQRRQELGSLQSLKYFRVNNNQNTHHTQVFRRSLFPIIGGGQSWKWLLAVSLVYAGYDSQSKSFCRL